MYASILWLFKASMVGGQKVAEEGLLGGQLVPEGTSVAEGGLMEEEPEEADKFT